MTPLVIFKGRSVQQQGSPYNIDFLEDWNFTCFEKGWTNNQIALQWLRDVFIPETVPKDPQEQWLLILSDPSSIADSTPTGKMTFLVNYHKARIEAITKDNIIAGWEASG